LGGEGGKGKVGREKKRKVRRGKTVLENCGGAPCFASRRGIEKAVVNQRRGWGKRGRTRLGQEVGGVKKKEGTGRAVSQYTFFVSHCQVDRTTGGRGGNEIGEGSEGERKRGAGSRTEDRGESSSPFLGAWRGTSH